MKTSKLTGTALDWAVCKAVGLFNSYPQTGKSFLHIWKTHKQTDAYIHPSTDWAQGGPIIERESITLTPCESMEEWAADMTFQQGVETQYGPTPLIAAMRCYCCAKLGDEVEIPEELK